MSNEPEQTTTDPKQEIAQLYRLNSQAVATILEKNERIDRLVAALKAARRYIHDRRTHIYREVTTLIEDHEKEALQ